MMTLEESLVRELVKRYDAQHVLEVIFDDYGDQKRPPKAATVARHMCRELLKWSELSVDDEGLLGAAVRAVKHVADHDRVYQLLAAAYEEMLPRVLKRARELWDDPSDEIPEM